MKKMLFWIFSFLSILTSFSLSANSFDFQPYTHQFSIHPKSFKNGSWNESKINNAVKSASKIFSQCGVKINVEPLEQVSGDGDIYFDLEGYSENDEDREKNSALDYAKIYKRENTINIFFIDQFDPFYAHIHATAVPFERVKQKDQEDALNTIWISNNIHSIEFPSGYNVLAHELGHILLNTSHIEEHYIHNLMHASFYNLNGHLTHEQCDQIKSSPLLQEIQVPSSIECPEILSPLRGSIHFLDGANKNCAAMKKIIKNLENAKDSLSDLTPLSNISFLMSGRSDLIQYSDRNFFEASLEITYDDRGEFRIRKDQEDILWIHELGHAILNAKLEEDWPWYKGRMKIMKDWGSLVLKSLDQNEEDNFISNQISELINSLKVYPNNFVFEDLLAPYHELFADAIAVIYTRDPQIIKKALAHPQGLSPDSDRERDFSENHSVEDWIEDEAHSLLAPTRSHLWKEISKFKPEKRSNQEIVRALYNAIRDEVIERTENPKLWNLSVPEINKRLIKKLNWF